jgi:hypothetical protein
MEHIFWLLVDLRVAEKSKVIIYHHHEIFVRKNTIMPYIGILGLWPD